MVSGDRDIVTCVKALVLHRTGPYSNLHTTDDPLSPATSASREQSRSKVRASPGGTHHPLIPSKRKVFGFSDVPAHF